MKSFFSSVFLTFRGALIGQIIPVAAMPFISHLYGPETYGLFVSILSIGIIASSFSMLQLEVAVVLPKTEDEASRLTRCAVQTGLAIALVLTVATLLAQPVMHHFAGLAKTGGWLSVTPLLGLLMSWSVMGGYMASRQGHFNEIGRSAAWLQVINCGLSVGLGFIKPLLAGLVASRVAGQAGVIVSYTRTTQSVIRAFRSDGILSLADMRAVFSKYRKFPLYNLPVSLLLNISRECVPVILIFFHYPHAAGFYALVRSVLMMPSSLLSTSLGQIFYHEAAHHADRPEFARFIHKIMLAITCIIAPGCAYVANRGSDIFALVFGQEWAGAGAYVSLFLPVAMLFILGMWANRIFEVRGRQEIVFRIQTLFDTLSVGVLFTTLWAGWTPVHAVAAYIACQVTYLLVYLGFVFHFLTIGLYKLAVLIVIALAAAAAQSIVHIALTALPLAPLASFAAETALTTVAVAATALYFWRVFKNDGSLHLAQDGV